MQELRAADRQFAMRAVQAATSMHPEEVSALKRHVCKAAWRGGVDAMLEAGWQPPEGITVQQGAEAEAAVPPDLWVGARMLSCCCCHL